MRSKQHHTVSCALVANNLQKSHFGQWFVRIGPSGCKRPGLMNRDQNYINEKLNNEWINPSNLWRRDPAVTSVRPHRGGKDCWGGQSGDSQVKRLWFEGNKQKNNRRSSQVNKKEKRFSSNICQLWQVPNQRQSWWFDALSVVQRGKRGDLLASFCLVQWGQEFIFCFIICSSSCLFVSLLLWFDQGWTRGNFLSFSVEKCRWF